MRFAVAALAAAFLTLTARADEGTFDSAGVKIAYFDEDATA